jgi:hypothetical protein
MFLPKKIHIQVAYFFCIIRFPLLVAFYFDKKLYQQHDISMNKWDVRACVVDDF